MQQASLTDRLCHRWRSGLPPRLSSLRGSSALAFLIKRFDHQSSGQHCHWSLSLHLSRPAVRTWRASRSPWTPTTEFTAHRLVIITWIWRNIIMITEDYLVKRKMKWYFYFQCYTKQFSVICAGCKKARFEFWWNSLIVSESYNNISYCSGYCAKERTDEGSKAKGNGQGLSSWVL